MYWFFIQLLEKSMSLCINDLVEHCEEQKRLVFQETEFKIQILHDNQNDQIDQMSRSRKEFIETIDQFQEKCTINFLNKIDLMRQTLENSFYSDDFINNFLQELEELKNFVFNNNKIVFIKSLNDSLLGYIDYDKCFTVSYFFFYLIYKLIII